MREATREQEEQSVAENMEDIVEVYAERLSAVTHAFALCCQTLQRATRRSESHTTCMILGRIMCEFECVVSVCMCDCSPAHIRTPVRDFCRDSPTSLTSMRLSSRSSLQGQ